MTRPSSSEPKGKKNNKWDLPTVVNLNARSLSCEKMDELQITVETNNVSIVCVTETWFKEYMDIHSLTMEGFAWRGRIEIMVEAVV